MPDKQIGHAEQTGVKSALDLVDELGRTNFELKRELRSYEGGNTVGRDVEQLRGWLHKIHTFEVQIAQRMGISWSPDTS